MIRLLIPPPCLLKDHASFELQVLLKPIVSQLVIEPPTNLEDHHNIPSIEEVDNLLVICTGQMAVTAGSDLLWKPLNHEVNLMLFYYGSTC